MKQFITTSLYQLYVNVINVYNWIRWVVMRSLSKKRTQRRNISANLNIQGCFIELKAVNYEIFDRVT
jgi:hypothetical protein